MWRRGNGMVATGGENSLGGGHVLAVEKNGESCTRGELGPVGWSGYLGT